MMSELTKQILITGANKGIGLALACAILNEHADCRVLLGARDVARGEAALAAIVAQRAERAGRVSVLAIDVCDDASVQRAASSIEGPLYAIVNNAGIGLGSTAAREVIDVNTYGPRRVVEAFAALLDPARGRVVNISSASGPSFVSGCSPARIAQLTDPHVTWLQIEALIQEYLAIDDAGGDLEAAGFSPAGVYGFSKACLNAYTIGLARTQPHLLVNACTPGFIETDLTRPYAEAQGVSPAQMGMKPPEEGTRSALFLLFGEPGGRGWYFGSDAQRSPLDRYRSPGDPPYTGD
jgi:NAD(P)-dependent dehydrogenase (short-subunit alcohol dehydrogenase family)